MPLVERLMGEPFVAHDQKIPVHTFFAAGQEIVEGRLTVAGVKSFLAMDAATASEFDALVAQAPTGTNALQTALKSMYVNRIHAVFILAESRIPGYSTPAEVRTKLGL
jgi:hypothetical protein